MYVFYVEEQSDEDWTGIKDITKEKKKHGSTSANNSLEN